MGVDFRGNAIDIRMTDYQLVIEATFACVR